MNTAPIEIVIGDAEDLRLARIDELNAWLATTHDPDERLDILRDFYASRPPAKPVFK